MNFEFPLLERIKSPENYPAPLFLSCSDNSGLRDHADGFWMTDQAPFYPRGQIDTYHLNWTTVDGGRHPPVDVHWIYKLDTAVIGADSNHAKALGHCKNLATGTNIHSSSADPDLVRLLIEPSVAAIATYFKVLARCIWDVENKQWLDDQMAHVHWHAMLIRFWDGQEELPMTKLKELAHINGSCPDCGGLAAYTDLVKAFNSCMMARNKREKKI